MALISAKHVSFSYEGHVVLEDVDFSVNAGDYLVIIGENGSGKSTLVKGLLSLKKPSSGEIVTGDGLKQNEIGYLPQQSAHQKDFPASVYEIVISGTLNSAGFKAFYTKKDHETALANMELLEIKDLKDKCYHDLSGGQQQRVLLARALCAAKKLILLDEPVSGLDPNVTAEFYRTIRMLNKTKGITVIMVSHDIHGVFTEASHILYLSNKQLYFGTREKFENSDFGKNYLSVVNA